MPLIQVSLTPDEDKILAQAAALERRSKREQLAYSAIQHARSVVALWQPDCPEPSRGPDETREDETVSATAARPSR